jgi:hypothetical protein
LKCVIRWSREASRCVGIETEARAAGTNAGESPRELNGVHRANGVVWEPV